MVRTRLVFLSAFFFGVVSSGCTDETVDFVQRDIVVSFAARVGSSPANCTSTYADIGSSAATAQLADARFFVSQLEVRGSSGQWFDVDLDDTPWQQDGVALLDFEDATGTCTESGTPEINTTIAGTVPEDTYDALRFRLGIPFPLNHVDPAVSPPPFNVPGMFWTWRGGYKFVRLDWLVSGGQVSRWNVHIGSVGCVSAAPTEAPSMPCTRPNEARIEIDAVDPEHDVIAIDLAAFVQTADLAVNTQETPPGCQSSPAEPQDCAPIFSALGMNFETGACTDSCAGQTVFSRTQR